jgi:hypothetical protein
MLSSCLKSLYSFKCQLGVPQHNKPPLGVSLMRSLAHVIKKAENTLFWKCRAVIKFTVFIASFRNLILRDSDDSTLLLDPPAVSTHTTVNF